MAKEKILMVEDDKDILELVRYNLEREGYSVNGVKSGESVFGLLKSKKVDLILLDIMLPGIDGLEICRRLKQDRETRLIPIIMMTAKGEDSDIVAGLELGADDYVTKPFSPKVLIARIRAVLRRQTADEDNSTKTIRIHEIVIHPGRHEVRVNEDVIDLSPTEFNLLHLLARRPGWVFTRYQIVDALHGEDYPVTDRSIDVQCVGLRKKLGKAGQYIETVRGIGYRFKE